MKKLTKNEKDEMKKLCAKVIEEDSVDDILDGIADYGTLEGYVMSK